MSKPFNCPCCGRRKFTCDACGETHYSNSQPGDAEKEMLENFGQIPEEEQLTCCDRCYNKLLAWLKDYKNHLPNCECTNCNNG